MADKTDNAEKTNINDMSQIFVRYAVGLKLLKKNPVEGIKYLTENKVLFNISDETLDALEKEHNKTKK